MAGWFNPPGHFSSIIQNVQANFPNAKVVQRSVAKLCLAGFYPSASQMRLFPGCIWLSDLSVVAIS
jgi:hypothetical protein